MRQVLVQGTGIATWIVLAKALDPVDFGIFGALALAVQSFGIFAELNIGLALIRQSQEPTSDELNSIFSLQFIAASVISLLAACGIPYLFRLFPNIGSTSTVGMAWVLVLAGWLNVFRLVPTILLERRLQFTQIAVAESLENVMFNCVAIIGAVVGLGIWSLVFATLARSVAGVGVLQYFGRGSVHWRCQWTGMRNIILTGLGFQSFAIVSFMKDLVMPVVMVWMVGAVQFGYFVWARDLTFKLITFSRLVGKVSVPTIARLMTVHADIVSTLRRTSALLGLFYWPVVTVLIGASSFYIPYVFSSKWLPAQPVVIALGVCVLLQVWANPMWSFIQARSPACWPVRTVAILTAFELGLGLPAVRVFGILGAALILVSSTLLAIMLYWYEVRRQIPGVEGVFQPFAVKLAVNAALAFAALLLLERMSCCLWGRLATVGLLCILSGLYNWIASAEDRSLSARIVGEIFNSKRMSLRRK